MRILVTGATGFAGRWLIEDFQAAGHDAISSGIHGRVDVTDRAAVMAEMQAVQPDAVAHLAGVAYGPDAAGDPGLALAVNVAGTLNVTYALGSLGGQRVLLVSGSSDVYGAPELGALPINESAPVDPRGIYGLTKAAQEAVALEAGRALGIRVVVTRSFNHTGPRQRRDFAIPAFASRILDARVKGESAIPVGNVDVRRDIADVRDVVRAYRLLLELAHDGGTPSAGLVVNVATGRSIAMRDAIDAISTHVGYQVRLVADPGLTRTGDAPEIRGDPSRLQELVGWRPEIPFETTISDLVAELSATR